MSLRAIAKQSQDYKIYIERDCFVAYAPRNDKLGILFLAMTECLKFISCHSEGATATEESHYKARRNYFEKN